MKYQHTAGQVQRDWTVIILLFLTSMLLMASVYVYIDNYVYRGKLQACMEKL